MSPWQINQLAQAVRQGAVFAYPSDTIWGLGCHPLHQTAVQRILDIKQRPMSKGLILLASRLSYLESYLSNNLTDREIDCLQTVTPQPTTWLVETGKHCPNWLCGQFSTIAIRLTDHPFIQQICAAIQAPLVSTSANRSGKSCVRNSVQMRKQFGDELDFIVSGFDTGCNRPSEIKSLLDRTTIRNSA